MQLKKALQLRKSTYTKKWRGKDGKWKYEYGSKKKKTSNKISVRVRDQLGNLEIIELDRNDPLAQMYLKKQAQKKQSEGSLSKLKELKIKTISDIDKHKIGNESRYHTLKRLVGEVEADKLMRKLEIESWDKPKKYK